MNFYSSSSSKVLSELHTSNIGLSAEEVNKRLAEYGKNLLAQNDAKVSRLNIFLSQCKSPLVIILFIAGTISGIVGELSDMLIIYVTVLVNTIVGFVQENKANQALQKLSSMVDHTAVVIRDSKKQIIPTEMIVPGDIMLIEPGDSICADGRVISSVECEVNEAPLTGESVPIQKKSDTLTGGDLPLGDRINMVYRGTTVVNGKATIVVTATGAQTELGNIARLVKETPEEATPLQKELKKLAKTIGIVVITIVIGIIFLGLVGIGEKYTPLELFQTAIAVAVAAIPESLAISLTIILAISMQSILKRRGLVRRLVAAETLGSVSVICTDKTGTLTKGIMQVSHVVTANETVSGDAITSFEIKNEHTNRDILLALRIAIMANNATIENPDATPDAWHSIGDTTESALVRAGMPIGLAKHNLDAAIPRIAEIPFTSERKFMATLHQIDHESLIYMKGAPEVVLSRSKWYEERGEKKPLNSEKRQWFEQKQKELAHRGLRLLGVAYQTCPGTKETLKTEDLNELVFVGLIGLSDPVRSDVPATIARCQAAGIRVIMLTGDHRDTALGIGQAIGLPITNDADVIDGPALAGMSDTELTLALKHVSVFSRMNPGDKIRIVTALQAEGEVVAVTGDGVNDAPALKGASIGVAVGSGSDVAKETADLVLLDDSFTTIVAAVEEGRRSYHNLKKVILYLLSGSFSEIVLIVGSMIIKSPLALLPAQILWVNIIQESFPTMALAFDKAEPENMTERPRRGNKKILDTEMKWLIGCMSTVANLLLLLLFIYIYRTTGDLNLGRTITFGSLTISSLFYVYAIRSQRYHIWQKNPFDNWYLNGAVLFGFVLFLCAVYLAPFQKLLHTVPLDAKAWFILIGLGITNLIIIETIKAIFKMRIKKN